MEWLADLAFWHWMVLGLVLLTVEIVAPSSYLMWPGISALFVGLIALLFGPLSGEFAVTLFTIMSIVTTMVWIKWLKPRTSETDRPTLNRRMDQYIGRKLVLREDFVDGFGHISVDDSRWRAEAVDGSNLKAGTRVEVVSAEGVSLMVQEVAPVVAASAPAQSEGENVIEN